MPLGSSYGTVTFLVLMSLTARNVLFCADFFAFPQNKFLLYFISHFTSVSRLLQSSTSKRSLDLALQLVGVISGLSAWMEQFGKAPILPCEFSG